MVVLNAWKNLLLVSLGIGIVSLRGCTQKPTDEQLEVWRKEASDRNAEIVADKTKKNPQREWNLVIQGQTANNKSETFSWPELLKLGTTNINTIDANNIIDPKKIFKFRGIAVSTLLTGGQDS
ncbi:MAG: hypothetical protein ACKO3K_18945 [Cuspidothrix sp.]